MVNAERIALAVVCLLVLMCAGVGAVPWWMGLAAFVALSMAALAKVTP